MNKNNNEKRKIMLNGIITAIVSAAVFVLLALAWLNSDNVGAIEAKMPETTKTSYSVKISNLMRKPDYAYLNAVEFAKPRYNLTDEEKRMGCFVADHEDHTNIESRQCIMQVIMNRVNDERFPDTVYDVLYAKKQFTCMKYYGADYTPSDEAVEALRLLLYGEDIFDGANAVYFAASYVKPSRIARGLYEVKRCGESKFWGQK